ncbi:MAG: hypothetical protein AAF799_39445 [Myxococcota bacterium]
MSGESGEVDSSVQTDGDDGSSGGMAMTSTSVDGGSMDSTGDMTTSAVDTEGLETGESTSDSGRPGQCEDPSAQCNDGNSIDGDGCDNDCTYTEVEITAGLFRTCAIIEGGRVRCWGSNVQGQAGLAMVETIGDDELPNAHGDASLSVPVDEIFTAEHVCGRSGMGVKCWGYAGAGSLGYGNTENLGDDELLTTLPDVDVGTQVSQMSAGSIHTCILNPVGLVKCWGRNRYGSLGYGDMHKTGDNEVPAARGYLSFSGSGVAVLIASGDWTNCVVLDDGGIQCWGDASDGRLGTASGSSEDIGDDELPDVQQPLYFDGAIPIDIAMSHNATCVLLDDGTVRCWGTNNNGELGIGYFDVVGNDETAPVGAQAIQFATMAAPVEIEAGRSHFCALFETGDIQCWGRNNDGQLGLPGVDDVGRIDVPFDSDLVDLGGQGVRQMSLGNSHTCAVTDDYSVYCWGSNGSGELGYGMTEDVGDDESPTTYGPVQILGDP